MSRLTLSFLGPFQVTLDGQPITGFGSDKIRALLVYLAVEARRPHARGVLADMLWPGWPRRSAFANLRAALSALRRAIGDAQQTPPFLLISRETIQFNTSSDHDLDVALFADLVTQPTSDQADGEGLRRAVLLYRGGFLEGFSVGDSAPFEEWAALQREHLAQQLLDALQRLAAACEQDGDYARAQYYARQQVEREPTCEEAHRQLMRALALGGQRTAALTQYEACRRTLAQDLGVEPARDTVALYEAIRQGTFPSSVPLRSAATVSVTIVPPLPGTGPAPGAAERPVVVAREGELDRLGHWLDRALGGQGCVAFVAGDAGSGKSTLVGEFTRRAMAAHPGLVVAQGNGNAYTGSGDPYLPFLEVLQMLTGDVEARWVGGSITREHAERLWALVPEAVQALLEQAPELIGSFVPGTALLARARAFAQMGTPWMVRLEKLLEEKVTGPAELQQSELFERITRVLTRLAQQHALVVVLDDLQWADLASINLLLHLGRRLAGSRMLVVGAYRIEDVVLGRGEQRHPLEPVLYEFQRMWGEITIDLSEAEGRRFVDELIDREPNRLGVAFRDTLYRQTRGQALFVVELLEGLKARGDPSGLEPALLPQRPGRSPAGPNSRRGLVRDAEGYWTEGGSLDWERLPARVEAVIAESIRRLPEQDQALLAAASVEGEEFTAEVLARVQGMDESQVVSGLSRFLSQRHRLVHAVSTLRVEAGRLSRYRFRNYLFQHYLYHSLDVAQRGRLHEEVGNALEALYGAVPRTALPGFPESTTNSMGSTLEAAYRGRAAESAGVAPQLARHFQAAGLTDKALIYLRQAAERALFLLAHEEAILYTTRGLSLLASLPDTPERARAEFALQCTLGVSLRSGRGVLAAERGPVCARLYELALRIGDAPLIFGALSVLATFHRGRAELRQTLKLEEKMHQLAQRELPAQLPMYHVAIGHTLCRSGQFEAAREQLVQVGALDARTSRGLDHLAYALWYLGYPDQALQASQAAWELAPQSDPWITSFVLANSGVTLPQLRREVGATREKAEELLALAAEPRFAEYRPVALIFLGWAHAQTGQAQRGLTEMREGLEAWRASGYRLMLSQYLALLAEGYASAGRVTEGLDALTEAVEHVELTGERYYEAEIHRLEGELLLQGGGPEAEAEACFLKAIEVARGQEARSWELRATVSLARLWRGQGKGAEARERLAAIYGWFTEGFGTPDLVEARGLLDQLMSAEGG